MKRIVMIAGLMLAMTASTALAENLQTLRFGASDSVQLEQVSKKRKAKRVRGFSGGVPKQRRETDSGSCPCSSSKICVGPRGGTYCITSGGNKRYV